MRRRPTDDDHEGPALQFDLATVLLVVAVVVVVLYLSWEIWAGHPFTE